MLAATSRAQQLHMNLPEQNVLLLVGWLAPTNQAATTQSAGWMNGWMVQSVSHSRSLKQEGNRIGELFVIIFL